jgi:hypothetical protein
MLVACKPPYISKLKLVIQNHDAAKYENIMQPYLQGPVYWVKKNLYMTIELSRFILS